MKSNIVKVIKRGLSFLTAVVLVAGIGFVPAQEAKAAEIGLSTTTSIGVRYVKYNYTDCTLGKAPTYSGVDDGVGYVFGGWYYVQSSKYKAFKAGDTVPTSGYVYAKFVPAYVLSVKCQNFAGTQSGDSGTKMRIISSLDSTNYQQAGFEVEQIHKNDDGTYQTVTLPVEDTTQTTKNVYNGLDLYESQSATTPKATFTPQQVFGGNASKYLTAGLVGRNNVLIPQAAFGDIIRISPYWITMDGTKVYGLVKYAHVEDGIVEGDKGPYMNVPVNLKNAKDVIAGVLDVGYDSETFELFDVEHGVFEEMEYNDRGKVVRLAGNVKDFDATGNQPSDNNVYVNLRFKLKKAPNNALFTFGVADEAFSNKNKDLFEGASYNVWDVQAAILMASQSE